MNPTPARLKVLLDCYTPEPSLLIERCARISHDSCVSKESDLGSRNRLIRKCIELGHESVLEHASATFIISGISRACSHQLVRHRIASYTQRSQRYVNEEQGHYVIPPSVPMADTPDFVNSVVQSFQHYKLLVSQGIPQEDARFLLPNAWATEIAVTMNFRELRHFFSLRCDEHAQWEIRAMACEMLQLIAPICYPVFVDLVSRC